MSLNWTNQQKSAIDWSDGELIISASAGSGKTAVLIQRCLELISNPRLSCSVDQLLVVTFTDAAAQELRDRLTIELHRRAKAASGSTGRWLGQQIVLLDQAAISTIHAFCFELVSRHFHVLGISPAVQVFDAQQATLFKRQLMEEIFEQYYQRDDQQGQSFRRFVRFYGQAGNPDRTLINILLGLHEFLTSLAWPEQWIDRCRCAYKDLTGGPWQKFVVEQVKDQITQALEDLKALEDLAQQSQLDKWPEALGQLNERWCRWLVLAERAEFQQLHDAMNEKQPAMPRVPEDAPSQASLIRDQRKSIYKRLCESGMVGDLKEHDWSAMIQSLGQVGGHVDILLAVLGDFRQLLDQRKGQRGQLEFADQQRLALKLLLDPRSGPGKAVPSGIARKYRQKFKFVLVDEYQDVNELQDTIIRLVCRPEENNSDSADNLCVVGDVKQSIYRFRLADPRVFQQRCRLAADSSHKLSRIDLQSNFRSRGQIIDAVNAIFSRLMIAKYTELDYDLSAYLKAAAHYPPLKADSAKDDDYCVELHLLDQGDRREDDQAEDNDIQDGINVADLRRIEREAYLVAKQISRLLDQKLPIKQGDSYRPIRPGDIVILLRAVRHHAGVFQRFLARQDVQCYCASAGGLMEYQEVVDIISLLEIIDNPYQDIPLAAVLRSPIVSLEAQDLATIRQASDHRGFYQSLLEFLDDPQTTDKNRPASELVKRLTEFMNNLGHWRTLATVACVSELIEDIYLRTGYQHYVAGTSGALQRYNNLQWLYQLAYNFADTDRANLKAFLEYIQDLEENGQQLAASAGQADENSVRIMSIHASKGLEFPVVIAADLGGKINQQSLQGDIIFHRDALLAVREVDLNGQKKPTPASSAVAGQLRKELFAEELRLLYVGLTRACEKLIMVGSGDIGKLFSRYAAYGHLDRPALPGSALLAVNSMLQWILMALAGHSDLQVLWHQMELKNDQHDQNIDRPFGSRFKVSYYNWNQQEQWKVGGKSTGQKSDIVHWPDDMLACVSKLKPLPVRPGPDEDELAGIVRMLEWRYPYQQLVSHKTKFAVTEFKGHHAGTAGARGSVDPDAVEVQFATGGELFRWPDDPALQGAARGSAVHKFIQYVDLADELNLPGLTDQLGKMVDCGRLTVQETSLIDLDMVAKFFDSQLGRLLKQYHQDVQREVQFCYSMGLRQLPVVQKLESDEKILVKGVIDCLVHTGQGLVIIDYKTDQVSGGQVAQRAEVYRNQLEIYCRAMQEILGQPVLAGHLHFLMPCKSVTIWPADNMAQRDEN